MINTKKTISEYLKNLKPREVLDIGCGKGRISSRFIKRDANVTGVDKKKEIIKNKNFKFVHRDIRKYNFNKKYDLIIASLVLHFLSNSEAIGIIKKIKKCTQTEGYNFLACLSEKDSFYRKGKFYPNLNELKKLYSEWKIIKSVQGFTPIEKHGNLVPHKHNIIFILAKKVS